jgi:hypothetical protein
MLPESFGMCDRMAGERTNEGTVQKFSLSLCALGVHLALASGCASSDDQGYDYGDGASADTGSLESDGATDALGLPDAYTPPFDATSNDATANDATLDDAASNDATFHDAPSNDAPSNDAPPAEPDAPFDAGTDAGEPDAALPPLIGAWTFDEGTGTSSADLSGNGHPAVFSGGASWGPGKSGTGLLLDGLTGYADVGVTLIDTTKSFSVLSWAQFITVSAWEVTASEDDVTGSLFGLKLRGDNNLYDFDTETSDVMTPGFVVAASSSSGVASAWVHLAGVYDATGSGSLTLYVNGALQARTAVNQVLLAATGHFVIGRGLYNAALGSYVHGTIDDVGVYEGALTAGQVAAIYASGFSLLDAGVGPEDAGVDSTAPPPDASEGDGSSEGDSSSDASGANGETDSAITDSAAGG